MILAKVFNSTWFSAAAQRHLMSRGLFSRPWRQIVITGEKDFRRPGSSMCNERASQPSYGALTFGSLALVEIYSRVFCALIENLQFAPEYQR
jgi:hypothetical protein